MTTGLVLLALLSIVPERPTFNKDVAPIIHEHCAACHRPGESGPFNLLTYRDVRKFARQISVTTESRFMPPWLPEAGYGDFAGERRLTQQQIDTIASWARSGAVEGLPEDLPELPTFTEGWQLGEPDLIVRLERPYTLPAEGVDAFRNFVIPVPVPATRFVRALELRPGNPKVVHHAVIRTDRSRSSSLRDAEDDEPGFGGMEMGNSQAPDGHLIGWTPGKVPFETPPEYAWRLPPGTQLVVQLHMLPSGRPEAIQPEIGLYFSAEPPSRRLWGLTLYSRDIDIPAGESNHVIEESFELPAAVELLSVYPHAHYVGKRLHGFATLPDGSTRWLMRIDDWDFNWQDEYRYVQPVALPRGATITMRYTYDNSADNIRNPNNPPVRVTYGKRSSDEMGSLSFEVLPAGDDDVPLLTEALSRQMVAKDPGNWLAHDQLGVALQMQGRPAEAILAHNQALKLNPGYAAAHEHFAAALLSRGRVDEAIEQYRRSLTLDAYSAGSHFGLANALWQRGQAADGMQHYFEALRLDPYNVGAHYNLGLVLLEQKRPEQAIEHFRAVLAITPEDAQTLNNLANALAQLKRYTEAIEAYQQALVLAPDYTDAMTNLAIALIRLAETHAASGRYDDAVQETNRAIELATASGATELTERLRAKLAVYERGSR